MDLPERRQRPKRPYHSVPKALLSWSTGKDSAFALYEAQQTGDVEVAGLVTTVTSSFGRVSMHGVRESLLDRQIEALGLPCVKVSIPSPCPNEVYEREMGRVLADARERGVPHLRNRRCRGIHVSARVSVQRYGGKSGKPQRPPHA